MHVNSKKIAFLGILLAITVILVYAGTIIESNTLFFLCAASLAFGVAQAECGKRLGVGFFIACTVLTFILVPQKMYCITLAAMNLYILAREGLRKRLPKIFPYLKFILFNSIYIPVLIGMPSLFYKGKQNAIIMLILWGGGQAVFGIYDYVYRRTIYEYWPEFRHRIHLEL